MKKSFSNAEERTRKAIVKKIWDHAPKTLKRTTESCIVVGMAVGILLDAPAIDECGKAAVQDMAHELNYTWDPFDGFCA